MKRILVLLVALTLLIGCCSAVSETEELEMSDIPGMTAAGVLPIVTEPVTITIGMAMQNNVIDYDTNWYTQYVKEQTGIDIEFFFLPSEDAATKLDMMISAGDKLPDIILEYTTDSLFYYGSLGYYLPMNDYFDEYAYYWYQSMEYATELEKTLTNQVMYAYDGNIYAFPNTSANISADGENLMYINQQWLDNLGLEMPTTLDEFYDVLVAFRDGDPNGNGIADEIPLVGYNSYDRRGDVVGDLINAFTYYPYDYAERTNNFRMVVNDGEVSTAVIQEEYREALRFMKKLYDEKLLSPLSFSQTDVELKAMVDRPAGEDTIVGCMGLNATSGGKGLYNASDEYPKALEYAALPCLIGPEGVQYAARQATSYSYSIVITKDCENPEVAFRLLDWFSGPETSITARYGEKDVDWKWAEEGDIDSNGNPALFTVLGGNSYWGADAQNKLWRALSGYMFTTYMGYTAKPQPTMYQEHVANMFNDAMIMRDGKQPEEVYLLPSYNEDEQKVIDAYARNLTNLSNEWRTMFIIGEKNLDDDWNTYIDALEEAHMSEVLAAGQSCYTRMNQN